MVDLCGGFWIRETGTGQQVAQLHDRYMMMIMMMMMIKRFVFIAVCLMKFCCKIIEDGDNAETCKI